MRRLQTYGSVLLNAGRYREAERFFIRAIIIRRQSNILEQKPFEFAVPTLLSGLSDVAERLGNTEKALMYQLHQQLLVQADSPERDDGFNSEVAPVTLVRIVDLLHRLRRNDDASGLLNFAYQQAKRDIARDLPEPLQFPLHLDVFEKTFGPVDRSDLIASALGYLGQTYAWMTRNSEALPLLEQLKATRTNIFGDGNPRTALAIADLADTHRLLGHFEIAKSISEAGFNSVANFLNVRSKSSQFARAGIEALRPAAFALLEALYADPDVSHQTDNREKAFEVFQRLRSSSAAAALEALGERLSQQDPTKRDTIRRVQDLGEELTRLDASLMEAVSRNAQSNTSKVDQIREKISRTESALQTLKARRGGKLDELIQDDVVPYSRIRTLIEPTEALIAIESGFDSTFVFVATKDQLSWFRAAVNTHELQQKVAVLRCGVDSQQWSGDYRSFCRKLLNVDPANNALPFDLSIAHELYHFLIAPAESLVAGKSLLFSLSGPLTKLPPHLLVGQGPAQRIARSNEDFANVDWLIKEHAISIVPSVASLAVLRSKRKLLSSMITSSDTREPYLGLGNPTLTGNGSCTKVNIPRQCSQLVQQAANQSSTTSSRGVDPNKSYFLGSLADVQAVRQICPLPETEVELRCVAQNLGGKLDRLVLGEKLTETEIKRLPLDRYRIIHFATHALLADETSSFGGTDAEPALVLTPPKVATPRDDGLLKASEIAQLKLNADWVILSACNTAGAGSMDTDALSGLARAFFYAGARTLLVSHWAVDSAATVFLISRAFGAMAQNHQIEPAEAIRQSTLSMMADPVFAHPTKWAPFVLIGDNVRFM
jgi:CHAT domain-containing protein